MENIEVIASPSNNLTAAREAAAEADVAIVVVGATSGESVDRPNLQLENQGDDLITAVANVSSKTVVLMQAKKGGNRVDQFHECVSPPCCWNCWQRRER